MSENRLSGWIDGIEKDVHAMFSLYYPKAVRFGVLSGLNLEAAQDCAQEAFTLAFQRRQQLHDVHAFPLWFHRIVVIRVIVALTARQRQSEVPEEALLQNEEIWQIVQYLDIKPRLALVLRYHEGFSLREIVGMLDMRENAIQIMIHSALERFRSTPNLRPEMEPVEPIQVKEEELVRSVLKAHVPPIVDTEPRWERVATHLSQHQSRAMHRSIPIHTTLAEKAKVRPRFSMRLYAGLVAVGITSFLLVGINFGGSQNFWGSPYNDFGVSVGVVGTFHLYSDINQKQQSSGITITVTKAYSDAGRTLIAYQVKLSHDLAQHYQDIFFGSYNISYQGDSDFIDVDCQYTDFPHDGTAQNWLLTLDPQKSAKSLKNVSITWKVRKVYLIVNSNMDPIEGNWDFNFTIPYSTSILGSGGPFLLH